MLSKPVEKLGFFIMFITSSFNGKSWKGSKYLHPAHYPNPYICFVPKLIYTATAYKEALRIKTVVMILILLSILYYCPFSFLMVAYNLLVC